MPPCGDRWRNFTIGRPARVEHLNDRIPIRIMKKHNRLPMYDPISAVVLSQLLGENLGMTMQENEDGFYVVKDFTVPLKETFFQIMEKYLV